MDSRTDTAVIAIAVISDVHGNRWALEAVLADIRRRGLRSMVNLGDCFYGPLDPRRTAEILETIKVPTVRGNEDRILVESQNAGSASSISDYTRANLSTAHLRWIESLPETMVVDGTVFLCHGTPRRDDRYLLEEVTAAGVRVRAAEAVAAQLEEMSEEVILCGHSHVARVLPLSDGRLVLNPGSVGWPAFSDDKPVVHAMEAGSPHARYGILSRSANEWRGELVSVPYDWHAAASHAEKNGRPDWAHALRTGRVER